MTKHLLKKLLNLKSDDLSSHSFDTTSRQSDKKQKYVQYYSTDKGRSVVTKIPSKMSIIHKQPTVNSDMSISTYSDDLSDVSTPLLRKVLQTNNIQPLSYYNTDSIKSLGSSTINTFDHIQNKHKNDKDKDDKYSKYSKDDVSYIYSNSRDNSRDKGDDYESVNSYLSDIYSNIGTSVYSNTDTSVYSNNISDKSSYNSNVETSYDSFYDDKNFKNTWFIFN
jgi:hypothetical protein